MKQQETWYALDNQANIYPAISNRKNTSVFRWSCNLNKPVVRAILQKALDKALESFPYYLVIMRRGLFWYYLEPTDQLPVVVLEHERPCKEIFQIDNKRLLFEVSYYGNRINLEVFHALADGGGAIEFLRAIVHYYLIYAYPKTFIDPPKLDQIVPPLAQTEDGFQKHFQKAKNTQSPFKDKAFLMGGTFLPLNGVNIISAEMLTKDILALSKAAGASLTAYLTALMIVSIYYEMLPRKKQHQPVVVNIPVDLRSMFPSETFRNFFSIVDISYDFKNNPADFTAVLDSVQTQMKEKVQPDSLARTLNYNMSVQENVLARAVPLFIKNFILKIVYRKNEKMSTTVITNLGRITMPSEFAPYIKNFSCFVNPSSVHKTKLALSSYENVMNMNFLSRIGETNLQKHFIRHLADNGIPITITTNGGMPSEALRGM